MSRHHHPGPIPPIWLAEFHRQWLVARGKGLGARSRAFSRDWPELLEAAGVRSAEDIATAGREVEALEKQGRLVVKRHRYRRYLIERVGVPLEEEAWLREVFQSDAPEQRLAESLERVAEAETREHPLHGKRWKEWCAEVTADFSAGANHGPLRWRSPEGVREVLDLVWNVTSQGWEEGTLIREASVRIGMDSKGLERRQRVVESALGRFFGQPTPLEALGIVGAESRVMLAGKIRLHFADGGTAEIDQFESVYHLTGDLERAVRITTSASRLITVENTKTSLRRLASMNGDGGTLLVGCSFPTRGVKRLLELLPGDLPLFHFGDTDPAGFHILAKVREAAGREVTPWKMQRRLKGEKVQLGDYDRRLLEKLLVDPKLEDVRPILRQIRDSGDKGDFEQEALPLSDIVGNQRPDRW